MAKKQMNVLWGQRYGDVNDPKTRWHTCGTLFIAEDGKMSIKIDTMPVGKDFNGFFSVMEKRKWDKEKGGWADDSNADSGEPVGKVADDAGISDEPINMEDIPF